MEVWQAPAGLVVLSNSAVLAVEADVAGFTRTHFGPSPPMSTYLLAICVGQLEGRSKVAADGVVISVWSTPQQTLQLDMAQQVPLLCPPLT